MNFVVNHAPGVGSSGLPVDQQSSTLPLYHGGPLESINHRRGIVIIYATTDGFLFSLPYHISHSVYQVKSYRNYDDHQVILVVSIINVANDLLDLQCIQILHKVQ